MRKGMLQPCNGSYKENTICGPDRPKMGKYVEKRQFFLNLLCVEHRDLQGMFRKNNNSKLMCEPVRNFSPWIQNRTTHI
jgi:hypothetical protein